MPESLGAFDPTTTYDEAVAEYEDASSEFWRYLSDHAVQLLGLRSGERILDVPCGTGHSVFPAAERVGPSGRGVALTSPSAWSVVREKARSARAWKHRRRCGRHWPISAVRTSPSTPSWASPGSSSCPTCPQRCGASRRRPVRAGRARLAVFGERHFYDAAHHLRRRGARGRARRRGDRAVVTRSHRGRPA